MRKLIFILLSCSLWNVVSASVDSSEDISMGKLLSLSLEDLMQVRVETADKIAEKIGEIPASVVLITRQDIRHYGYTTLDDILRHVSGVYHIDFYGLGGAAYGVRGYLSTGSSNRNIIILINGISQVLDSDSTYLIPNSPVPVEAIDRIEIVRGPQSTIYGSGAFFGVINIITNETNQKSGSASYLSLLGGSGQTHRWFGRTSYVGEHGKVVLNVGSYKKHGLNVPYNRLESSPMGLEGDLTTDGRLENYQRYIDLSATYKNFSFDITHANTNNESFMSVPTVYSGTIRKTESTHLRLGYKIELFEQLSLNSKLTYIYNTNFDNFDTPFANRILSVENDKSSAYEGEVTLQWKMPKQFDLMGGLYYRYAPKVTNYVDVPAIPNAPFLQKSTTRLQSGEALVNRALFSQLNYYLNEQWKWIVGLRLEQVLGYAAFAEYGRNPSEYQSFTPHYPDQKLAIIPRLAAIYTPNEKHIFKWMYGKAINSPSFGQNTTSRLTSELPPLQAEHIETIEFDYITYLSPRYMLNVNVFHNHLQNLFGRIDVLTSSGQYINLLGNGGKWTTNGLELSLHAQPTAQIKLEFSSTYQKTKDANYPDIKVAYSPNLLGQFKGSYQLTPKLSLGLTSYYVSKMEVFFDPSLKNPDGTFGRRINGTASKGYLMTGANLHLQDWFTKGTFVNLRVNNLFNKEVTYPTYTRNSWMDRGSVGEKRNFMFTVGYEF